MNNALILALAGVAVAACTEAAPEPLSPDVETLVASAPTWSPSGITQDMALDPAAREELEEKLGALHATMLDLHRRHEVLGTLEGQARADLLAELEADAATLHERHREMWDDLDPEIAEALGARLHERMQAEHDGEDMESFHQRMRGLHGSAHDAMVPGR